MQVFIDPFTKNVSQQGLYSISLPEDFSLSKTVEEIQGEKQKTNEQGQLLFITPEGEETTESEDNEPIIIPDVIVKQVTFAENPYIFSVNEVAQRKFEIITQQLGFANAYADEFLTEDDIDFNYSNHSANTGVKVLELLSNGGQCKTKTITLTIPAKEFVLYLESSANVTVELNGIPFVNDKVLLSASTLEIVLVFKNETINNVNVNAYAILY